MSPGKEGGASPILLLFTCELFTVFLLVSLAVLLGLFWLFFSDRPAQHWQGLPLGFQQRGLRRFLPFLYLVIYLRNWSS